LKILCSRTAKAIPAKLKAKKNKLTSIKEGRDLKLKYIIIVLNVLRSSYNTLYNRSDDISNEQMDIKLSKYLNADFSNYNSGDESTNNSNDNWKGELVTEVSPMRKKKSKASRHRSQQATILEADEGD